MQPLPTQLRAAMRDVLYADIADTDRSIRDMHPLASIIGTSGDDTLTGTNSNDIINGGLGADSMAGGKSGDTYYVDNAGDVVVEAADEGTDRVIASIDYVLSDNVENLILTGTASLSGTGNASANDLTGNAGHNLLNGMGGNDWLRGNGGNDTIDGGDGWDNLYGDYGNDQLHDGDAGNLYGGEGDDTLEGAGYLFGENGNDWLVGTPGNNHQLYGGAGNDRLIGSTDNDALQGDEGNDTVNGGGGNDAVLDRDSEVDTLSGGGGIDSLTAIWSAHGPVVWVNKPGQAQFVAGHVVSGFENLDLVLSSGNDVVNNQASSGYTDLSGGDGDDQLRGGSGGDTMWGGSGNDTLAGGSAHSELQGGEGDDRMNGGVGDDNLVGSTGVDRMYGGEGNDTIDDAYNSWSANEAGYIDGGAGLDIYINDFDNLATPVIWTNDASATVVIGEDTITGIECLRLELTSGNDYIDNTAYAVNDSLLGAGGNDTLLGGDGRDTLDGGAGDDVLISGTGGGVLSGGSGNDVVDASASLGGCSVFGSEGTDTLTGEAGNDYASGGSGADWIDTGAGDDRIFCQGNDGVGDTVDGGSGIDTLQIYATTRLIWRNDPSQAQVVGGQTIISLEAMDVGGSDSDDIFTNLLTSTNDRVAGMSGNDTIELGAGNDTLEGWAGSDVLAGGAGNDTISCYDAFTVSMDTVVLDSIVGSDMVGSFSTEDRLQIRQSGIAVGDGDTVVEGATTKAAPGGYAASAELVIATQNISGELTTAAAAASIGQASSAFATGQTAIFVVDNGSDTGVYYFQSAAADAQVSAAELTLLAVLEDAMTSIGSYQFGS